jgi:hypothetical protein
MADQFSSPIDSQLPLVPDPEVQQESPLMYNEFVRIYAVIRNLQIGTTFSVVQNGAVATGTTQGDAAQLKGEINVLQTVPAGAGVILPSIGGGSQCSVKNFGANSVNIYPQIGGEIDVLGINNPFVLLSGQGAIFDSYLDTAYISFKGA